MVTTPGKAFAGTKIKTTHWKGNALYLEGYEGCCLSRNIINEAIYCDRYISQLEELHQTLLKKQASLITRKRVLHLYVYNASRSSFLDENYFRTHNDIYLGRNKPAP